MGVHLFSWNIGCINADEDGVRYVPVRPRPPLTLLRQYRNPWKAAYHHFQKYSDIKVKGKYLLNIVCLLSFSLLFLIIVLNIVII